MRALVLSTTLLGLAASSQAEIAVLANGTTFKIDSRQSDGDALRLLLKGGGEVVLPASLVQGFVPDEILDEVVPQADGKDLRSLAIEAARRHGLDPQLVLAVVGVESDFKPDAVSPKGARGLMQLMPGTAAELGVVDPGDPAENLEGGTRHLGTLVARYGDLALALAAYNAGQGAVARHGGVPPYRETQEYVRKVLRRYGAPR